ncbi:hypothetical protein EVAR_88251_1 [Eumeta japonica]|uniref:Uncharacterized protein n=1 Tax=Eumeta variegata TaxID=151549 RepID=A0A4C1XQ41_EUMVA|nr:hypothetical protein EVAR_88251_1 [Eumeta japonica]
MFYKRQALASRAPLGQGQSRRTPVGCFGHGDGPGSQKRLGESGKFKKCMQVFRLVLKGARNQAAGKLTEFIENAFEPTKPMTVSVSSFRVYNLKTPEKDSHDPHKAIRSKVYEGDLRRAVGLLLLDGLVAEECEALVSTKQTPSAFPIFVYLTNTVLLKLSIIR